MLLMTLASCYKNFLDQVPDDRLTIDEVFAGRNTAERFLNNVYARVPNEFGQRNPGGNENAGLWTGGSDEADYVWGFVQSNDVNIGNWDGNSGFVGDYWRNFYRGIRAASYFMGRVDEVPDMPENLKVQYKAEARALRAMYYFYLCRIYGPVILLGEEVIDPDADLETIRIPRSSMDECVAYISAQLLEAAESLPVSHNDDNLGRITRGVALAFRAQSLLYLASPLFNGNADYATLVNEDGKNLINQTYEVQKWADAAQAYKQFIDEFVPGTYELFKKNNGAGEFDPYLSTRDVFLTDWNSEVIFARVGNSIGPRQYEMTPYHNGHQPEARGSGGLGATQNMVNAFFMQNGRAIDDPESGYVEEGFSEDDDVYTRAGTFNQWVNREPRFYTNITYSGSVWLNTNNGEIITELFNNGNSGKGTGGNDHSTTGYIVRKAMGLGNWDIGNRTLMLLRLAEIYLSYAEALNESDPGNADILHYINLIRERAGIPSYGSAELPAPVGQDAVREAIWKERRVELAFENARFFDVRRWKIAEQTENGPIFGLNVDTNPPEFYSVVVLENRVFNKRHYFFPIPQNEINNNNLLIQNLGW